MNGPSATNGCAPTADRLPELALGILGGAERAEVLAHLDQCASCRAESADWAATADVLPTVLAEAEPPAGFEARTLERLKADRARVTRRSLPRRVLAVAAIVAAAMIVTLAAVRIIDARGSGSSSRSTEMTSTRMVGRSGHDAGWAFMTPGDERYVFLDVDYGEGTGRYRIEALDAAKRVIPVGDMSITDGHGAWVGEVKSGAVGPPATVRVVDADGEMLCWARFGPKASPT